MDLNLTSAILTFKKCYIVIVEKYKKCSKNNPLTPILKDEG